jgi:hypothetical protein
MVVVRFRCERIERHSVAILGRIGGQPNQERQTVMLSPSPTRADSPNRKIWKGIAAGELRLDDLEAELVAAEFELHREYIIEIRPADLEPTQPGGKVP